MSDDMIQTFLEETQENLDVLEEGFIELEKDPDNKDWMDSVFRAIHTIKGGAGLMGFEVISGIAHHLENVLDQIREGSSSYSDEVASAMLQGYDLLKQMIDQGDLDGSSVQDEINALDVMIKELETKGSPVKQVKVATSSNETKTGFYKIELKFHEQIFETGTDPLMLIYELEEVGKLLEVFVHEEAVPDLADLDPHQFHLKWTIFLQSEEKIEAITNIFIFVLDENDIEITEITNIATSWFKGDRATKELLLTQGTFASEHIDRVVGKLKNLGENLENSGLLSFEKEIKSSSEKTLKTKVSLSDSSNTIRVETEKLENILNHLAELLIAQSRVKSLVTLNNPNGKKEQHQREIINSFEEVDKIIRIVQEEVMNASMIPIGATFMRFQRMVRDLAIDKGKEIELVLNGKETDLDKKVIEQITDPLKHLVRNAVDHGIESPEERIANGKPAQGKIELNAYHQEGSIVIEIIDDGKGIDDAAVYAKAVEKNIITADEELTKEEIYLLLFRPGFSTAKSVTDISGRGVGLDVVMTNIKNLRGAVDVYSERGKGSTIKIKLPLTLAIIDGMMIRIGEERFIIPLNFIIEFIKAEKKQILKAEGKETIIHLRNEYLPYSGLNKILDVETEVLNPTDGILIIVKNNDRKLALLVDEILGQEQVVIKSIKENMEQTEGIAGATILGDGNVALILDIPTLFKVSARQVERVGHDR
ncbi:chemotaxis protein CheA [Bacillaceae bacterium IKA-2]|nr:chemotaxis protein CheA [Bacillaceae bacterium IKA-2]